MRWRCSRCSYARCQCIRTETDTYQLSDPIFMEPHVCKKQRLNPSGAHNRHVSQYAAHEDPSSNNAHNGLGAPSSNSGIKIEARGLRAPPRKPRPSQTPVQHPNLGYGSNLLKLQVDGLLTKLQKDYERKAAEIDNALRKLVSIIEHIPEREAASVSPSPGATDEEAFDMGTTGLRCRTQIARGFPNPCTLSPTKTQEAHQVSLCLCKTCGYQGRGKLCSQDCDTHRGWSHGRFGGDNAYGA